jgi:hypothetical protein
MACKEMDWYDIVSTKGDGKKKTRVQAERASFPKTESWDMKSRLTCTDGQVFTGA